MLDDLCAQADLNAASGQSNPLIQHVNVTLNAAGVSAATSLLARGMAAAGIINVAAAWWADMAGCSRDVAAVALMSLVENPPPGMMRVESEDEGIKAQNRKGMH
jgi:hypothetical protein